MRARRAENFCEEALEIIIKYVSEYSSPSHYASFKKINTDEMIKK